MKNIICHNLNKIRKFPFHKYKHGTFSTGGTDKGIENFNLNFDKTTSFAEFTEQMDKNIEIVSNPEFANITSSKLLEMLNEKGIDKTQEELEALSQILTEKGKQTVNNNL